MGRTAHWAALLAVCLLSWATVRSVTMQAAEAVGAPVCGMAGMAGSAAAAHARPGKARAPCEFCAAAAHAPLSADAPRLSRPTLAVWSPAAPVPQLGPRGPPSFAPKARGPPLLA